MRTWGRPACLPLLVSLLALAGAQEAWLEVTPNQGKPLFELSLTDEPSWIIRWNHSVTGITVSDYYRWDGTNMLLTNSHTPAFDAGLGHIPGRGRLESDGQGGYWILDINEPVPNNAYLLRVGSERVNHRILHDGKTYFLSDVAANERVRIGVVLR